MEESRQLFLSHDCNKFNFLVYFSRYSWSMHLKESDFEVISGISQNIPCHHQLNGHNAR